MSMDGPGLPARIARIVVAMVASGIVAGIVFLILIQEAQRRGHTDLDFNHTLGTLVEGAQAEARTTNAALGVIGDTAAPTGLIATLVLAIAMMVVHGLVIVSLVRRGWLIQGLVLAVVTFLALGLIYPPLASEHLDEPLGPFGSGFGTSTVVSLAVACLGFGIIGGRCYALILSAAWWTPRGEDLDTALEDVDMGRSTSLELPEQRGEDGSVRT